MISHGWISKSKSPYSSPVVCVRKKDGSLRLCVDYRQLNSKTQDDRQPIPSIQDILNSLSGNEGVVSKETVVLRRWGSSIQKFGFINGVDNVNWPPYRDSKN